MIASTAPNQAIIIHPPAMVRKSSGGSSQPLRMNTSESVKNEIVAPENSIMIRAM